MAINFQQVFERIVEIGRGALARRQELEAKRQEALQILEAWARKPVELRDKLEGACQVDPSVRCAIPPDEPLDSTFTAPNGKGSLTLLATDGSQLAPDRHAAVLFSLVNVGAIVMRSGSDAAPSIYTDSHLYFDEEVLNWTDNYIALRRDLDERKKILELSRELTYPLVTLTDGPLQLWESRESNDVLGYEDALVQYLDILSQLQEWNTITAGYVAKPSSNLIIRLLEIALLPSGKMEELHNFHPFAGVTDLWLFGRLLGTGQRSSVFALQSRSKAIYREGLALHFFYLNVGDEKHPSLARVEIPRWVARDSRSVDLLHAALLDQCRIMGTQPYPYILHRAHEIAVVRFEEKEQIAQMLELQIRQAGGEVGEISTKQSAKDLPGRGKR